MNQFCSRCGALFAADVNMEFSTTALLCVECGLSLEDPPEILPPSEADDDQVAYDLAEWPPEDRVIASADLVELGIPYRWEDNLTLVVPAGGRDRGRRHPRRDRRERRSARRIGAAARPRHR